MVEKQPKWSSSVSWQFSSRVAELDTDSGRSMGYLGKDGKGLIIERIELGTKGSYMKEFVIFRS